MESILKANARVKKIEEFMMCFFIWMMAITLIGNVVARFFFEKSLSFAEEVSTLYTVVVTFVGTSFCARVGRHITMTAIFDIMPEKIKKGMMIIVSLGTAAAMLFVAYLAAMYCRHLFISGRVTAALQIPLWIPYLIIPIALVFAAIQYLLIFALNVTDHDHVHTCVDDSETDQQLKEGDE